MSFLSSFWDVIWWVFTVFVFFAYLLVLFSILGDLFRDRKLNGFAKAAWILFLIFLPFVTALAYLIFRGRGMAERSEKQVSDTRTATDEYIRSVAGGAVGQIAQAKQLLDEGAITAEEFEQLKRAALKSAS